jgi:hypothetical protein
MIQRSLAWTWLLLLQAVPVQAIERGTFLRTLSRAGVNVTERRQCGHERNNVATYNIDRNEICISSRHTLTYDSLDEALTHEAVHAAQDCLAGQNNGRLMTLSESVGQTTRPFQRWLEPGQLNFIRANYPRHYWGIEVEAYALQGRPNKVAKLVSAVCQ